MSSDCRYRTMLHLPLRVDEGCFLVGMGGVSFEESPVSSPCHSVGVSFGCRNEFQLGTMSGNDEQAKLLSLSSTD